MTTMSAAASTSSDDPGLSQSYIEENISETFDSLSVEDSFYLSGM